MSRDADADVIAGQRRTEKIATLEAQAKGTASPSITPQEVASRLKSGDGDSVIRDPNSVDSALGEESEKPTTESGFAMFDFDEDPFELGLTQDFHGRLTISLKTSIY
jgi:hypothetical protein